MTIKRTVVGFAAATFIPPLGAMQLIGTETIADPATWLKIAVVLVGSFSSASIYALTQLNAEVGNPPVVAENAPVTGAKK